jgi:hypothetical protein
VQRAEEDAEENIDRGTEVWHSAPNAKFHLKHYLYVVKVNPSLAPETVFVPILFPYGTSVRCMAQISYLPEGADLVTMTHS